MRILYLNYEWDLRESCGAARHIKETTRCLSALGHRVIVHNRHRESGNPSRAVHTNGTQTHIDFRGRLSRYLHESAALARSLRGISIETEIIQRERPDIVLTRYSLHQFSSLVAARRCNVPIVLEVNAPLAYEYRTFRHDEYLLLPGVAEWSEAKILCNADALFVVSNPLKQYLQSRGVHGDLIRVIPNGVDVDVFHPDAMDPDVRTRAGQNKTIVGFVGSFANFHGIEALQDTIRTVAQKRPDVMFLMVGHSPLAKSLAKTCRQLGIADRVMFNGYVPPQKVPSLMSAADILIAPYAAQEFFYMSPIKIFEYMASGRAILATSMGQIAELIEDGETGVLYDPNRPEELTDKLLSLTDDPILRAKLGSRARNKVAEQFTWTHNAKRVADLLESVCAEHLRSRQGS